MHAKLIRQFPVQCISRSFFANEFELFSIFGTSTKKLPVNPIEGYNTDKVEISDEFLSRGAFFQIFFHRLLRTVLPDL